MEVQALLDARKKLEKDLLIMISDKLKEFRKETGYSIKTVTMSTFDIRSMSDRSGQYVPGFVRCELAELE